MSSKSKTKRKLYLGLGHWSKWQPIINKVVQTCTHSQLALSSFQKLKQTQILLSSSTLFGFLVPGFYTGWLLPAAMVGLGVFLYGLFTLDHNVSAREVCSLEAKK